MPHTTPSPSRVAILAFAAFAAIALILLEGDGALSPSEIASRAASPSAGPFTYEDGSQDEFERRAAIGHAHVIYAKSPGGAPASAERTARFREQIDEAAARHEQDPDMIEAMVLLESAGRPEVIAGDDPEGAAGLAQILAGTATDLLGMKVDLEQSRKLTERIAHADGQRRRRLSARRARIDERFDPAAALDGMGRYLAIAGETFGRGDLAVASYHMGIGNLSDVIRRYSDEDDEDVGSLISEGELSYARLYFDSSPLRNPRAYSLLSRLGDDSSTYYWRVLAALEIMRLWRQDRDELGRLDGLHGLAASAERVFHPDGAHAADAELVAIPPGAGYGYELDAGVTGVSAPALATLTHIAVLVRVIAETEDGLRVRDAEGYRLDIRRDYESDRQAMAFQFVLDRLRSLAVIDYERRPAVIRITVSRFAEPLLIGLR